MDADSVLSLAVATPIWAGALVSAYAWLDIRQRQDAPLQQRPPSFEECRAAARRIPVAVALFTVVIGVAAFMLVRPYVRSFMYQSEQLQ